MPLVFIHGVAARNPEPEALIVTLMRRYLTGVICPGRDLSIEYAYWGDVGASFAWGGAARPRTPLLGQGVTGDLSEVQRTILAADLLTLSGGTPSPTGAPGPAGSALVSGRSEELNPIIRTRLADLDSQELSDLLATVIGTQMDPAETSELLIAADEVAHDPGLPARLAQQSSLAGESALLVAEIETRVPSGPLVGQGAGSLRQLGDRVAELLGRGAGLPGVVTSRLVAEFREPINDLATRFVGDVLEYVIRRGNTNHVGAIPERFISALRRARIGVPDDEPTVVVSHSMGGQVVYDAVTSFLPEIAANHGLRVDFWCATASQVGLFAELDMFLATSSGVAPEKLPFPDRAYLGGWWNVWDHNDFISYTARPIFEGVDDEAFDSGMTLIGAHSGYLTRPSFYRRFADKLTAAKAQGWYR